MPRNWPVWCKSAMDVPAKRRSARLKTSTTSTTVSGWESFCLQVFHELLLRWPVRQGAVPVRTDDEENRMLYYAVIFFIVAIVAAVLGFGGIAAGAASI